MENFKEIAEKCLAGELSGTFKLVSGKLIPSDSLERRSIDSNRMYQYRMYIDGIPFLYTIYGTLFSFITDSLDIMDFIPNNMQEQIKIDVPEGKVPVMEQTENGVVITWKEKEVTYDEIYKYLHKNKVAINYYVTKGVINNENESFLNKMNILRKLTNIRNYFGKPKHFCDGVVIKCINSYCGVETGQFYFDKPDLDSLHEVVFAKREHAEQAIKMLGDELKYLFEPW